MPIIVNLDVMMAKRKISLGDLAEKIDLTPANLSILKTGKAKAIRFSTLEAICRELDCQPGDILEYREEDEWYKQSHTQTLEHYKILSSSPIHPAMKQLKINCFMRSLFMMQL